MSIIIFPFQQRRRRIIDHIHAFCFLSSSFLFLDFKQRAKKNFSQFQAGIYWTIHFIDELVSFLFFLFTKDFNSSGAVAALGAKFNFCYLKNNKKRIFGDNLPSPSE